MRKETERCFITGGAGFIGSHIVEHYASRNTPVTVYDNLSSGCYENISQFSNVTFIEGDVRDRLSVRKAMKGVSRVFHLAAEVSVAKSMSDPHTTEDINTHGTVNVLDAMVANNVEDILFASSAAVYGESTVCPKKIDMLPAPVSPYAISKLSGEYYMKAYAKTHQIRPVIARFFNVFGERQSPFSAYAAVIPHFIMQALKNAPLIIFGGGMQTRDFIYVLDLVRHAVFLLDTKTTGVYNIGSGKQRTIQSIADTIRFLTFSKSDLVYKDARQGDVEYSYADISRLLTHYQETSDCIGFDEGLQRTIDYYKGCCAKGSIK